MATLSSSSKETSQEETHVTLQDTDVLSDDEEDLTFSQLINRYNEDSMFSNSPLDDSTFENLSSFQSNIDDESIYTEPRDDNTVVATENNDSKRTQDLRTYLEKECFPQTDWSSELLFNASTDRTNYQLMDITKYVGNAKFKKPKRCSLTRIEKS